MFSIRGTHSSFGNPARTCRPAESKRKLRDRRHLSRAPRCSRARHWNAWPWNLVTRLRARVSQSMACFHVVQSRAKNMRRHRPSRFLPRVASHEHLTYRLLEAYSSSYRTTKALKTNHASHSNDEYVAAVPPYVRVVCTYSRIVEGIQQKIR